MMALGEVDGVGLVRASLWYTGTGTLWYWEENQSEIIILLL